MKYSVKLKPSGVSFTASDDISILDSALLSNCILEYSCRDGRCGVCKSKVINGKTYHQGELAGISKKELDEGYILTCCANPLSDIEIQADYFPELEEIKVGLFPCRVDSIDFPSKEVAIVKLRLPPDHKFNYLTGQYIDLIINGDRRSYSIANIQYSKGCIELHIKRVKNGLFSEFIFNQLEINQLLRMEGPFGTFFVRDSDSPIIFLAGGTGFAPVKAMVEQLINEKSKREIYIYWGFSSLSGFYSEQALIWHEEYENISFIPVCSSEEPGWNGRKGLVHAAVLEDFENLANYSVYACGTPRMIELANFDFIKKGIKPENYYSDAFISTT